MLPEKGTPSEIERALQTIAQEGPNALLVSGEGDLYANRRLIVELAQKYRLPAMSPYRDFCEAGALMAAASGCHELKRRLFPSR